MIFCPDVDELVWLVAADVPDRYISEDLARIKSAWFGPRPLPQSATGTAVFLGARSGLEVLQALRHMPQLSVHVVEADRRLLEGLRTTLTDYPSVRIHDSIAAFSAAEFLPKSLDYVRICLPYASHANLVCTQFKVSSLIVEASERTSGADLARQFRPLVDTLFIRKPNSSCGFDTPISPVEISVVVTAFGVENELPQCLDSLAKQTIRSLEVIVVDDGSKDRSGEIADRYAADFPDRFRVIHQANAGCAASRTAGLLAARGDYVGFVDGDDWVDPAMYEHLYGLAFESGAEVSQSGYQLVFNEGEIQHGDDIFIGDGAFGRTGLVKKPINLLTVRPTIWRRIYKKDFLSTHNIIFPAHIRRFDDLPFQFEVLANAKLVATTAEPYYSYRQGRVGQDILARDDKLFVHFDIFDYLKPRICELGRVAVMRKLLRVELNTHVWALSRIEKRFRREYQRRAKASLRRGYEMLSIKKRISIAAATGSVGLRLGLNSILSI